MMQKQPHIKLVFLVLLVQQSFAFNLYSQLPYTFQKFSNKDGFNQNTIFAIEQDKDGYLWIGTSNGLIKYDGYDFERITSTFSDPLHTPQNRVKYLYSCSKGMLWILSQNALHVYMPDDEKFFEVFPGSIVHLNRIIEISNGTVWIIGENYIGTIDMEIKEDSLLFHPSPNLLPSGSGEINLTDLVEIADNNLIIGSNRGLYRFSREDEKDWKLDRISDNSFSTNISRIQSVKTNRNILWIGSMTGLYKVIIDNNKLHVLDHFLNNREDPNSISDDAILDIAFGVDDVLWIGTTRGGLSCYMEEADSFINYTYNPRNPGGISSAQVNCIYVDSFNTLWLGTAQGGLGKLDLNQKKFFNLSHNPFDNTTVAGDLINFIFEDSKGYLWISSYRKSLSRSTRPVTEEDPRSMSFKRLRNPFRAFPDNDLLTIYEDKFGYFWLGFSNSLAVYDPSLDKIQEIKILSNGESTNLRNVRCISSYSENRLIIAGSSVIVLEEPWKSLRIGKFELEAYARFVMPETPNFRNDIGALLIDSQSRIWAGTNSNGLSVLELHGNSLDLVHEFRYTGLRTNEINHSAIFCLYEDDPNTIWAGTFGGGINKLILNGDIKNTRFEYITTEEGLPDNAVYGILPENDSILWASTDMGLCRINKNNGEIISYNINDGVSSNNYRRNAYHKGVSGYYYFGGLNGLTLFKPVDIKANTIPPAVKLASIEINNHRIKKGEKFLSRTKIDEALSQIGNLKLTHKENSVAFEILVQHSSSPVNNSLAFMLEGFDPDWITRQAGKLKQVYTNLPSGKYVFKVKGFNGDGLSSTNEINLPLTILAPWYQRWWAYTLFALIIFSIGLGVSWYFVKIEKLEHRLQYEQKDKERIQQVNQAKLQFFTSISHEFRTPLSLISATFQMFDRNNLNPEQKKQISLVDKNTNRLLALIDQLLTFRKSEQGHLKLKQGQYSLGSIVYPIAEAFENFSLRKGINFIHTVKEPEAQVVLDYEKMERVLFNIISNAFKFTPENGTIKLEGRVDSIKGEEFARFDITDNGKGIPREEINNIFQRFYQLNTAFNTVGTGIGLSLSKSIVELHNGFIEVESDPGILTRFSVFIPKKQVSELKVDQLDIQRSRIDEYLSIDSLITDPMDGKNGLHNTLSTILIVDDEQEFRNIIKDVLLNKYRLLEAKNGKEAEEMIKTEEPDLIVSDVMMPEMNGYELCKRIKSDIQTCHIPVILLTALDQEEMHIQGVEFGADSYITKPFNVKFLLVTIRKLIENRTKIKEHFSQSFTLPAGVHLSSIDQNFIESVNKLIEKNLDDSSFGVERLSKEMCLSPSQFYRKLKQFTGQVPNAYVRNYRLQRAALIIAENPGISIKTVMFEVGIESASYFSLAFKTKFGVLPSEYHARNDYRAAE